MREVIKHTGWLETFMKKSARKECENIKTDVLNIFIQALGSEA